MVSQDNPLAFAFLVEISLFLVLILLIFAYQVMSGRARLRGLISGFDLETGSFYPSPGRLQMLIFTIVIATSYLLAVAENPEALPDIPQEHLFLLTGSGGAYLAGKSKIFNRILGRNEGSN